jgi:hypothetical protein
MKNKPASSGLSYSSTTQIHGNVFAWNKPVPTTEKSKQVTENILRWEDDGGPVSEVESSLPQVAETNTPRLMDGTETELP